MGSHARLHIQECLALSPDYPFTSEFLSSLATYKKSYTLFLGGTQTISRPQHYMNIITGKSGDNEGEVKADRRTVLGGQICNGRGGTSERHLETFSQLRVAPEKMFIVWGYFTMVLNE